MLCARTGQLLFWIKRIRFRLYKQVDSRNFVILLTDILIDRSDSAGEDGVRAAEREPRLQRRRAVPRLPQGGVDEVRRRESYLLS